MAMLVFKLLSSGLDVLASFSADWGDSGDGLFTEVALVLPAAGEVAITGRGGG